jgi:hypothetical protein
MYKRTCGADLNKDEFVVFNNVATLLVALQNATKICYSSDIFLIETLG